MESVEELIKDAVSRLLDAEQDLEEAIDRADEENLRDELKELLDDIFEIRDRLERLI